MGRLAVFVPSPRHICPSYSCSGKIPRSRRTPARQARSGRGKFVLHQAEQQDGVGISVEDRVEPTAKLAPRRASERRNLLHTKGGASAHRTLEIALQHDKATQLTGIQAPGSQNMERGKARSGFVTQGLRPNRPFPSQPVLT